MFYDKKMREKEHFSKQHQNFFLRRETFEGVGNLILWIKYNEYLAESHSHLI